MSTVKQLLNKDLRSFVTSVEKDLMFQIILNMKNMQMTMNQAQNLAQEFLASLPVEDKEQVIHILAAMGAKYPQAQELYIKYANEYYTDKNFHTVAKALSHVKHGEIARAVKTVKGGNHD